MIRELERKARVLALLRRFFGERGFLELDTPILQNSLVPELHVSSFSFACPDRARYLLPSPELAMKRVLCELERAGEARSVYQIAHCFRCEEQEDALHRFEFSMLEFYALNPASNPAPNLWARDLLSLVAALLHRLGPELAPVVRKALQAKPELLSFDELCRLATGEDFTPYWNEGRAGMRELYRAVCGRVEDLNLDDLFHLFLVDVLEPYIADNLPYCALYPYPKVTPIPAWQCSKENPPNPASNPLWVERWELYLCGKELANACREERRPEFLRSYCRDFERDLAERGRLAELPSYDLGIAELWQELPDCSGVALGISRLLAL